jgi:hypothetical protein
VVVTVTKRNEGIHIEFSRENNMLGGNEMCEWKTEHDDVGPNWLKALTTTWL